MVADAPSDPPMHPACEDVPQARKHTERVPQARKHTERVPLREEGSTSSEEMEPMETEATTANRETTGFSHHLVEEPTGVPANVWRIHGRDYDLTSFVDEHPGGALFIMMGKGLDCTHFFEFYHLFSQPRKRLREYDVTPDGEKPPVPECDSAFMRAVRKMAREHFDQTSFRPGRHKASLVQWALMIAMLVAEPWFIWLWLAPPSGSAWAGLVAATLNWLLMCNMMHDGCHAALSTRPWLNHLGQFLGSAPWSCGQAQWWLQHCISHHPNINQLGLDIDAHHFPLSRWHCRVAHEIAPSPGRKEWLGGRELDAKAARRLAGAHNIVWHVGAYLVATLWMCQWCTLWYVLAPYFGPRLVGAQDARDVKTKTPRHGLGTRDNDGQFPRLAGNFGRQGVLGYWRSVLVANVLGWLLVLTFYLLPVVLGVTRAWGASWHDGWARLLSTPLPMAAALLGGLARGVLLSLVPIVVSSLCFMLVTQVSHIQEECQRDDVLDEPDPFKRQAQTSLDYSPRSRLTLFCTGGLNLQSIHHLMPSVSCVHYPALYPKFVEICREHGCMPQQAGSFWEAVAMHWRYVYRLGRGDALMPEGWPGVRSAA